eukprot:g63082.t1
MGIHFAYPRTQAALLCNAPPAKCRCVSPRPCLWQRMHRRPAWLPSNICSKDNSPSRRLWFKSQLTTKASRKDAATGQRNVFVGAVSVFLVVSGRWFVHDAAGETSSITRDKKTVAGAKNKFVVFGCLILWSICYGSLYKFYFLRNINIFIKQTSRFFVCFLHFGYFRHFTADRIPDATKYIHICSIGRNFRSETVGFRVSTFSFGGPFLSSVFLFFILDTAEHCSSGLHFNLYFTFHTFYFTIP